MKSLPKPLTDDRRSGGDGDVDGVVEEANTEVSDPVRLWVEQGSGAYVLVVHGGGFPEIFRILRICLKKKEDRCIVYQYIYI